MPGSKFPNLNSNSHRIFWMLMWEKRDKVGIRGSGYRVQYRREGIRRFEAGHKWLLVTLINFDLIFIKIFDSSSLIEKDWKGPGYRSRNNKKKNAYRNPNKQLFTLKKRKVWKALKSQNEIFFLSNFSVPQNRFLKMCKIFMIVIVT